jgi:hypothetical protein
MNTCSSKHNASKNIAATDAPGGSSSTTAKSSTEGESTIVNNNVPSVTVGVEVDATSREATATLVVAKSTKVQNPYKKQSAVAPAGAPMKSILTAGESTIASVNIDDVMLNNATISSTKFAKVQNPYKKQAAVIPALYSSTVTSDITVLHAATSITASSVTPSTHGVTMVSATTGMLY